ncbi:MAG TPA: YqzE family protein [Bacillales bacterium]|nr:YqzE family protein [Bacillales bacterium]
MSSNDLVRFITEQMVTHFNQPRTERKEVRKQRKTVRPPFTNRWFGVIPFAMLFFLRNLLRR